MDDVLGGAVLHSHHVGRNQTRMRTMRVFRYDCFGETLSFAESLGWANWLDDVDDDTDPQTIDEAEVDALNFIREKGFTIEME